MQNPFHKKSSVVPWIAARFALLGILIVLGIRELGTNDTGEIIGRGGEGLIGNTEENTGDAITENTPPQKTAEEIFQEIAQDIGLKVDEFSACLNENRTAEEIEKDAADGRSYGVTGTPAFFINGKLVVGALPYGRVMTIFEEELAGNTPSENRVSVDTDDDVALGEANAPITMIEFSDFQCPFCAQFHSGTFPQIKENYIDTGKVRFVIRDFPLAFHKHAKKAAEAAECAKMQGAWSSKYGEMERIYFEYVNKLFEKNNEWTAANEN